MILIENYQKYKWFYTSSKALVVGGKNAIQNEELLHLIKKDKKDFIVMHTSSPGSPFSIILKDIKKVTKDDFEECAIFTASFSQAWKSGRKTAEVDMFKASQLNKPSNAKIGTWQVKGTIDRVIVPLELYLTRQEKILRAVPKKAAEKAIFRITPGNIEKKDLLVKIQMLSKDPLSPEQLLSALPAGGIKVEKI